MEIHLGLLDWMAMAGSSSLMAYKMLFSVLGCVMVVTLVYTLLTDGSPFRRELLTPWMVATLVDFYVNVVAIATWVVYKESTWSALLWTILLVCSGSIATCAYIVKKLSEICSQDPVQNPVRHVFLRIGCDWKTKNFSIVFLKILFSVLGLVVFTTVVYTLITDGSPFRMELLTPWMAATLIDFYINVVAISVWVIHRESSWITSFIWIIFLICFGSITTCVYIVVQLFHLSRQDQSTVVYSAITDKSDTKTRK
ncbi:uncharacterized protein LOC120280812 [Dioscorea cayenensis subsp. rotundata]|uniref:Uncharacterized protein LOC120280812 n=1 Tax=Dioscorea cayennensis subsp. rotundata TaxID=55577 RepID=A0AB40CUD4_DIOCR|nr:uncharacterized protein LOC120280812 [Dioscorea cayenensis subsp. rotundata]